MVFVAKNFVNAVASAKKYYNNLRKILADRKLSNVAKLNSEKE